MGLDGGTIPSRSDLLRRSSWRLSSMDNSKSTRGGYVDLGSLQEQQAANKHKELARMRWEVCALSGEPLKEPIVACHLGRMYNKDSVLEYLLGTDKFEYSKGQLQGFEHLISLKAVFPIHLKHNPAFKEELEAGAKTPEDRARGIPSKFVCWLTDLEANGRNVFQVLSTCGHVFAEVALKETDKNHHVTSSTHHQKQPSEKEKEKKKCLLCNVPYSDEDVLTLNPSTEEETERLKQRWKRKLKDMKKDKKEKKDKRKKKKQRVEMKEEKEEEKGKEKEV